MASFLVRPDKTPPLDRAGADRLTPPVSARSRGLAPYRAPDGRGGRVRTPPRPDRTPSPSAAQRARRSASRDEKRRLPSMHASGNVPFSRVPRHACHPRTPAALPRPRPGRRWRAACRMKDVHTGVVATTSSSRTSGVYMAASGTFGSPDRRKKSRADHSVFRLPRQCARARTRSGQNAVPPL